MRDFVFGANIIENITTGMYQDSKVIYREYIQNACDQIDKAVREGLLGKDEGIIEIWLEQEKRTISIEDNATGIPSADFERTLGDVAASDKKVGEDKGFRGIGRLCGLAFCRELIFTSTAAGEDVISVMKCDAVKMREMINRNEQGEKFTAADVLQSIFAFDTRPTTDVHSHWFKVELIEINSENTDLLNFSQIKDYLSFVAPVPYQNTFIFRGEVYKFAESIGQFIDQYSIKLNGEDVYKKYSTNFKTSKGDDEIFSIHFEKFYDESNNLLAWMWFGVSRFRAVISKDCKMRGLRLRKENIQIGNDDALQKLFKEDRGHHYFVGEVFAVSKNLIPNSQRDYFNENPSRLFFERKLRFYFNDELYRTYYEGSAINSAFRRIDEYEKKQIDVENKKNSGDYVDEAHFQSVLDDLEKSRVAANKAQQDIEKKKQKASSDSNEVVSKVIERLEGDRKEQQSIPERKNEVKTKVPAKGSTIIRRTDKLSAYSKNERKLISKIFAVIVSATDENTAETIIKKIEDELQ
ncbi:MAG: ATP-binding protein [Oscillospiraceae bacterium]